MYTKNSSYSLRDRVGRMLWDIIWLCLFRPTPKNLNGWRRFLLRLFGAKIGHGVHLHPSAKIWAPWNLEMSEHSCLGEAVDCYCVDKITIGAHSTVSQYSFLCTASHDYADLRMPLMTAPIVIGERVWIAANVFIAPGVTVHDGTVIRVCSNVLKDISAWTVVSWKSC